MAPVHVSSATVSWPLLTSLSLQNQWQKTIAFFRFKISNLFNLLNHFATSICNYVTQVVISTGILKFFAKVCISRLTKVHNSYLYFFKKEDKYFKIFDKFNKPETEKLE